MESRSTKENCLWQFGPYTGTQPIHYFYSQNADFSTFPLLTERVYADLEIAEPRIRRQMPFAAFQHVCAGVLNAKLIDIVRTDNAEDNRFIYEESPMNLVPEDICLPAPIVEYIQNITQVTTPAGDVVKVNISDAIIPAPRIEAADGALEQPAGGFGPCGAANHNAYEANISPLVTSRLVQATIDQNTANEYGPWSPLPDGMFPVGSMPTLNLLGYTPRVERLHVEGLGALINAEFPNGNDMRSRLRWSCDLVARVSGCCSRLASNYEMRTGRPVTKANPSMCGWTEVPLVPGGRAQEIGGRLTLVPGTVMSPYSMDASQCYRVYIFGLKRRRTPSAMGLCYVSAQGGELPGWGNTINSNFHMVEPFSPRIGIDLPSLRECRHSSATPAGNRGLELQTWLRRHFVMN